MTLGVCLSTSPIRSALILYITVVVSISLFIIITITCAARAPGHNSSTFVWTNFVNDSGWSSDGIVFLTGLANPNFMYAGIDGAIHLAEECSNAVTTVPLALISTSLIGFVTAFAFSISMVYSLVDLDAIINTPTGYVSFSRQPDKILIRVTASPSTKYGTKQQDPPPPQQSS